MGIRTRAGDRFEIECAEFGKPLENTLRHVPEPAPRVRTL
jgi:hypothetical protein